MTTLKLPLPLANAFRAARSLAQDDVEGVKAMRKALWSSVRAQFQIPDAIKLKVELDDTTAANYLVITDKVTNQPLQQHPLTGKFSATPPAPVQRPRWFMVDRDDMVSSVTAMSDFEDGGLSLSSVAGDTVFMGAPGDVAVDDDGDVFIKLEADDFTF